MSDEVFLQNLADLRKSALAWGQSLIEPTRETCKALQEFGITAARAGENLRLTLFLLHEQMENKYRKTYGRIPGSKRTKRLRKKRRDAINRFTFEGKR
jgi:hypothetical protein